MELIKDKWYKVYDGKVKLWHRDNHSWFIKFDKLEGNAVKSKEYIYTGDSPILNMGGNFGAFGDYTYKLADMNEVSKFLPDGHVDKVVEFKLPERWCIKRTPETWKVIVDYLNDTYDRYYSYNNPGFPWVTNNSDYNDSSSEKPTDAVEITFEQFKKYVLKENSMNKVEAPKTFLVKGDSKHLLKACYEEIIELGYKKASRDIENIGTFFSTNINRVDKENTLEDYKYLYINGSLSVDTQYTIFTLPQDYNKAIEHAKSAIQSKYWNKSKVKKMKFGSLEVKVTPGLGYVQIAEGKVTKEDLKKVIDWKSDKPKLLGYPVSFKRLEGDVSFGCKDGTWEQLYDIYNAM